jgi:hypothetical protein
MSKDRYRRDLEDEVISLGINPRKKRTEHLELIIDADRLDIIVDDDTPLNELRQLILKEEEDDSDDDEKEDGYDPEDWGECPHGNRDDEGCDYPGCSGGVDGYDENYINDEAY